jgi:bromodomain-containing factor 1
MNHVPSPDSGHADSNRVLNAINGDHGPDGIFNKVNGFNGSPNPLSPVTDSPNTPVSSFTPDVKIDIDYNEQESDVRHEPIPIKPIDLIAKSENASTVPQIGTPVDPESIPINPPTGTPPPPPGELLKDVQMAEVSLPNAQPNGNHCDGLNGDVAMDDVLAESSATTPDAPPESSMASANGSAHDDEDKPPPAKRARMHSDADKASLAHSATPPPASVTDSPPPSATFPAPAAPVPGPSTLAPAQFRFAQSTVRSLKKLKDAAPFLRPVDPIALNIPHYPQIVKNPMDFSTIERKLSSSNPAKPDPNFQNPRYHSADEFISDVRLIFQNCYTFNGPDHAISAMGKRIEEVFDKQIKQMPPTVEPKPAPKKAVTPPPPPPPPPAPAPAKKVPARRASTSVPVIRRSDQENIGRPKREIHPPPSKDLPYADAPRKQRKGKRVKDDGTAEQLKYCSKILIDLHRKQHYAIANPFYERVDWVKLDLPSYPKLIKKPMDMSTMRKKLDNHEYSNAQKFWEDFKLMIRNCFTFNPAGTPVNQAGIELQKIFDDKWKNLPPLHEVSEDEDEEDEDDSEEDRQRAIAMMESQIETMRGSIAALKGAKPREIKKKKKDREKTQNNSSSKTSNKASKSSSKKKGKKPIAEDDVLTFEQKKDLSEAIGKLDGSKLEKVINIIHEGVPEIKDSNEEIELEIDLLPASVLTKLYNFVIRPMRAPPTKRSRGKGTGTGGLKRKSMDEDVEAEKIRQLEQRMALFEQNTTGIAPPPARREADSDHSSDSSSASDSSGSDSE